MIFPPCFLDFLVPTFNGEARAQAGVLRPIAFFACTCHQVDIGGFGMGPDGRSVFEEGLYLPILPLARASELNRDLIRLIRANVRTPDEAEGDILAYVTANETSETAATRISQGTRVAKYVSSRRSSK